MYASWVQVQAQAGIPTGISMQSPMGQPVRKGHGIMGHPVIDGPKVMGQLVRQGIELMDQQMMDGQDIMGPPARKGLGIMEQPM